MTFLSDRALRAYQGNGYPLLHIPFERQARYGPRLSPDQIQPASIDVRLLHQIRVHPANQLMEMQRGGGFLMSPGMCVLGSTVERIRVPRNMLARIEGKSSLARQFLTIHSAGFIDPGFEGDLTLEIKNDSFLGIRLVPGQLIAQVSFAFLDAPAERPYGQDIGSHYQGQVGPTEARRDQ